MRAPRAGRSHDLVFDHVAVTGAMGRAFQTVRGTSPGRRTGASNMNQDPFQAFAPGGWQQHSPLPWWSRSHSSPTHAALGGLTPFEIDSNTTVEPSAHRLAVEVRRRRGRRFERHELHRRRRRADRRRVVDDRPDLAAELPELELRLRLHVGTTSTTPTGSVTSSPIRSRQGRHLPVLLLVRRRRERCPCRPHHRLRRLHPPGVQRRRHYHFVLSKGPEPRHPGRRRHRDRSRVRQPGSGAGLKTANVG